MTVNGRESGGDVKAWKHDGQEGWLLPLAGELSPEAEIAERLTAARAAIRAEAATAPAAAAAAR